MSGHVKLVRGEAIAPLGLRERREVPAAGLARRSRHPDRTTMRHPWHARPTGSGSRTVWRSSSRASYSVARGSGRRPSRLPAWGGASPTGRDQARSKSAMNAPTEVRGGGGRPVSPRRSCRTIGCSASSGGWTTPADVDIDAPEAWSVTTGSPSTIVAVIDTGIDLRSPRAGRPHLDQPRRDRGQRRGRRRQRLHRRRPRLGLRRRTRTTCRTTTATARTSRGRSRRRATTGSASSGSPGMPRSCR